MTLFGRGASGSGFANWLILPAGIVAVIFATAMLALFQDAFREYVPGSLDVGGFTLDNFEHMTRPIYRRVFLETLIYAAECALINLILGYPLAYALVHTRSAFLKSAILVITLIPLFAGDIVRTYAWVAMLGKFGFVNSVLTGIGLVARPVELLYTPTGVVMALVQYSMPIMVVMLAASISHVDSALERAAASLGAPPRSVFLLVTLPLTLPGIAAGVLTVFTWNFSAFATPQLIGGGKVNTIATLIYTVGVSSFNFPFAAALSLVSLLLIFLVLAGLGMAARRLTGAAPA